MSPYRSPLAAAISSGPSSPDHIRAMAIAAWRSRGVVLVNVDQLTDDWERQMLTNLANRIYGQRGGEKIQHQASLQEAQTRRGAK